MFPRVVTQSRSPSSALLPTFLGEGSPTKIDWTTEKGWYPYSNLSTGGPSLCVAPKTRLIQARPSVHVATVRPPN